MFIRKIHVVEFPRVFSKGDEGVSKVLEWPSTAWGAWVEPCCETKDREAIPLFMCGTNDGQRKDEHVLTRSAIVMDMEAKYDPKKDTTPQAWWSRKGRFRAAVQKGIERLSSDGIAHAWHTTHSHDDNMALCWRVWIPLAADVLKPELDKHWRNANRAVNERFFGGVCDRTGFNPERLMRLPAKHPERVFQSGGLRDGELLHFSEVLAWWNAMSVQEKAKAAGGRGDPLPVSPLYQRAEIDGVAHPLPVAVVNKLRIDCAQIAGAGKHAPDTVLALQSVARVEALEQGHRDNGFIGLVGLFSNRFLQHETRPLLESLLLPVLEKTYEASPDDPVKPGFPTARSLTEHAIDLVESRREQTRSETGQQYVNDTESAAIKIWTKGKRSGAMAEEEFEALAREQGLDVDTFKHQIFVVFRNDTWAWQVDGYNSRPMNLREFTWDTACAALAALGVSRHRFDEQKAQFKKLSLEEIMARYSRLARDVRASYLVDRPYFDQQTETFIDAVGARSYVEPEEDEEVHEWLLALGGEKLCDWVASVPALKDPTAILLLAGPKLAGKSMLAHALSRQWAYGAPANAAEALSESWNDEMAMTPFIFADEEVPKGGFQRRSLGARLREMITSPNVTLKRKHLPNMRLDGYVRIMISANNANVLKDFSNDVPTEHDFAAIAERVLVLEAGDAAIKVLDRVARRGEIDEWRGGMRVTKHCAFLAAQRKYQRGRRFLVEGNGEASLRNLLVADGFTNQVLDWFVNYAMKPSKTKGMKQAELAHVKGGMFTRPVGADLELYVALDSIVGTWGDFRPAYRMASTEPFLTALDALSYARRHVVVRFGEARDYWKVRTDYVEFYAQRVGIQPEALRRQMLQWVDPAAEFIGEATSAPTPEDVGAPQWTPSPVALTNVVPMWPADGRFYQPVSGTSAGQQMWSNDV